MNAISSNNRGVSPRRSVWNVILLILVCISRAKGQLIALPVQGIIDDLEESEQRLDNLIAKMDTSYEDNREQIYAAIKMLINQTEDFIDNQNITVYDMKDIKDWIISLANISEIGVEEQLTFYANAVYDKRNDIEDYITQNFETLLEYFSIDYLIYSDYYLDKMMGRLSTTMNGIILDYMINDQNEYLKTDEYKKFIKEHLLKIHSDRVNILQKQIEKLETHFKRNKTLWQDVENMVPKYVQEDLKDSVAKYDTDSFQNSYPTEPSYSSYFFNHNGIQGRNNGTRKYRAPRYQLFRKYELEFQVDNFTKLATKFTNDVIVNQSLHTEYDYAITTILYAQDVVDFLKIFLQYSNIASIILLILAILLFATLFGIWLRYTTPRTFSTPSYPSITEIDNQAPETFFM